MTLSSTLPKQLHSCVGTVRHAPITKSFLLDILIKPITFEKSTQTESEEDDWEIITMRHSPKESLAVSNLDNKNWIKR